MNQSQQKRRTDWQSLIDQQANSGQSVSDFCRDQCESTSAFYKHKTSLGKSKSAFTKLHLVKPPKTPGQIRCQLPNGLQLEWDEAVDANTILSIIRTLS